MNSLRLRPAAARCARLALGFFLGATASVSGANINPPPHPDNSHVDGSALVVSWNPPVYPPDALKEKVGGRTTIRIIVDEKGAITAARILKANDARLGEAALAAVKTWKFSPAMEKEKPVASCLDVPLAFIAEKGDKSWPPSLMTNLGNQPAPASVTPATKKSTPRAEYPAVLVERKLSGIVRFTCTVDPEGRPVAPRIVAASHVDFVLPALAALARWEYSPAKQGDLPVPAEMIGEITFDDLTANRGVVLAANGITGPEGAPPAATPQPLFAADPVWPHALLMQGGSGEADVEFTVDETGRVKDLKLRSASRPEYGAAALAALETWQFRPAIASGRTVAVPLWKKVEFAAVAPDAVGTWETLVQAARAGTISEASGLDRPLTPLFRVPPVYPTALLAAGRPKGSAEIEFVIARDGRARLPRIVSATHEEFGWAAATAIAQWVFQEPRRAGVTVDVKVRIPVTFTPPPL